MILMRIDSQLARAIKRAKDKERKQTIAFYKDLAVVFSVVFGTISAVAVGIYFLV